MQPTKGRPAPKGKVQRQSLISNYTSQRLNETQETILARDTQPSQLEKQKYGSVRRKCSQPVPNSQMDSFSDSDLEEIPSKSKKMNNSMRAFRSIIDEDSDEDAVSFIKETPCTQNSTKSNDSIPEDVVYDSQEEKSDGSDKHAMDLNDVHSQMSFRPTYTSTQRELRDNNIASCTAKDRKRKKTSALADRSTKKSLPKIAKTFDIPTSSKVTNDYDGPLPSKRPKSNDFSKNAEYWELEDNGSATNDLEPMKRKTAKISTDKSRLQSQCLSYGDVDISQVSTGKSYDVEEPDSFLHHRHNRTSMFSINDISQVVENMKDMVETMTINRTHLPIEPPVMKDVNVSNFKKFRKAPQGRYNPTLSCSKNIIGEEDFKDFRAF